MRPAAAWRLCVVAGLATLLASTAFGWIAGLKACGPTGGAGPIIAFELAPTPDAIAALFGGEPCTSRFVAAQRAGLWLDMLGFIPAYTAFLALAGWALRGNGRRLALAAVAAALVAGLCDQIEGFTMFAIMDPLPGAAWLFTPLFWAVRIKFALLSLTEGLLGLLLLKGRVLSKMAGAGMIAGAFLGLLCLLVSPHEPGMMRGHSYAWIALLLAAIVAAIRPTLVSRANPA